MSEPNVSFPTPSGSSPSSARPPVSRLAIASLICACFAFCLFVFAGVPALIMAFLAMRKIDESRGAVGGKGIAIGSIVVAGVAMVIWLMAGLLAVIAVPGYMRSRQLQQGRMLLNDARQVDAATDQW